MPSYKVVFSENPNDVYLIEPFLDKVPGTTHNPRTFLLWLYQSLAADRAAMWLGLEDEKRICGYVIALPPWAGNRYAFVLQAYTEPFTPLSVTAEAFEMVESWAMQKGAQGLSALTVRDELGPLERRYGFKRHATQLLKEFRED